MARVYSAQPSLCDRIAVSQAPEYNPTTSFADDETNQASGRATVRTVSLDVELSNISSSINALNENLQAIQRADTKLRDFVVEPYAISEQLRAMLVAAGKIIRGAWAINTQYAVGDLVARNAVAYVCQTAHNSGPTFNLGFWIAVSGDGSAQAWAEQASLSQAAAAASEADADASAAAALGAASASLASQLAAAASALAAQNSADSIAGLAPVNLSAFMLGFLANNNAATARAALSAPAASDLLLLVSLANLGSTSNAAQGLALAGFNPALNYIAQSAAAALKDNAINTMWFVTSQAERAAIQNYTSTTDHTSILNACHLYGKKVYSPFGRWNINTDVGVSLQSAFSHTGDGLRTMFVAMGTGASQAQLVSFTKGSMFKRAFTPGVANPYVMGGYLADFSVITTPQTPYGAGNYKQIGIDFRNITRSVIERVYVGNNPDVQSHPWMVRTLSAADQTQNYGIVLGTRPSGTDYCGGEGNTVRDCQVWGLYKNITIDDSSLSPSSSAHATTIDTCDVQGGHELITQSSQYNAGSVIKNVTIQGTRRQSGNANPTVGVSVSGYNCSAHVKYAEMGTDCDVLFSFASASKRCRGELLYYSSSAPSVAAISDTGTRNSLIYPAPELDTVPTPDVTTGTGEIVELFNKAFRRVGVKFYWDGSAIVILNSVGVLSITRNGVGDYTVVMERAMPNADWRGTVVHDSNASGHGGTVCVANGSQSASNFRFFTYAQNGATTTQVDSRRVYFIGEQT